MIKIIKIVFITLVFLLVGSYSAHLIFFNNQKAQQTDKLIPTNDSLKKEIDSLRQELFVMNIQLSRYEYIIERTEEEISPDCKNQLDKIFKETE